MQIRAGRNVERAQRHHDRKFELRAATLSLAPNELKKELKQKKFAQILKEHGFKTRKDFHVAMLGKIKDELHKRGLSDEQINKILKRGKGEFSLRKIV